MTRNQPASVTVPMANRVRVRASSHPHEVVWLMPSNSARVAAESRTASEIRTLSVETGAADGNSRQVTTRVAAVSTVPNQNAADTPPN